MEALKKIFAIFEKNDKIKILILIFLSVIGALFETLSIGVVLPFVNVIMDTTMLKDYPFLWNIVKGLSPSSIIYLSIGLLLFMFVFKNVFVGFLIYFQARFSFNRQIQLSKRLLKSYLLKPYNFFFSKNLAELQRNFNTSMYNIISGILLPAISMFSEILVVLFIFLLLIIIDPISTLIAVSTISFTMLFIYIKQKKVMFRAGKTLQDASYEQLKWINQSLLGIKEVKIRHNHEFYIENFYKYGKKYASASIFNNVMSQFPRLIIELIAIISLCMVLLVSMLMGKDLVTMLPTMSLFAVGAYRIMPSFNRVLTYINSIRFCSPALQNVYDDLMESKNVEVEQEDMTKNMRFESEITVSDLSFRYKAESDYVIDCASFSVKKGSRVGIIGESGQGKTTLLDLLLGLLKPEKGQILVDGVNIEENLEAWHKMIGYVPQNVYLIDDTIVNNVALGIPEEKIDRDKIKDILNMVKLKEYVETLPQKEETLVGDNGMLLSGGQRQRIAIARALYNDPEILVMDEATSSLDNETEAYINDTINSIGSNKTLIIVAHRDTTIAGCDEIYRVEKGKIIRSK